MNAAHPKVITSGQKKSLRQWLRQRNVDTAAFVLPEPPAKHAKLSETISEVAKPDTGARTCPAPLGLILPPIL